MSGEKSDNKSDRHPTSAASTSTPLPPPSATVSKPAAPPTPPDPASKSADPDKEEKHKSLAQTVFSNAVNSITDPNNSDSIKKGMEAFFTMLMLLLLLLFKMLFGMGKAVAWLGGKIRDAFKSANIAESEVVRAAIDAAITGDKKAFDDAMENGIDQTLLDALTKEQREAYEKLSEPSKFEFLEKLKEDLGIDPSAATDPEKLKTSITTILKKMEAAKEKPEGEPSEIQEAAQKIFEDREFQERNDVGLVVCPKESIYGDIREGPDNTVSVDDEVTAAYKTLTGDQKRVIQDHIAKRAAADRDMPAFSNPMYESLSEVLAGQSPKASSVLLTNAQIREEILRMALVKTVHQEVVNPTYESAEPLRSGSGNYSRLQRGDTYDRLQPVEDRRSADYADPSQLFERRDNEGNYIGVERDKEAAKEGDYIDVKPDKEAADVTDADVVELYADSRTLGSTLQPVTEAVRLSVEQLKPTGVDVSTNVADPVVSGNLSGRAGTLHPKLQQLAKRVADQRASLQLTPPLVVQQPQAAPVIPQKDMAASKGKEFEFDNLAGIFSGFDEVKDKGVEEKWKFLKAFKAAVEKVDDTAEHKAIKTAFKSSQQELLTQIGTESERDKKPLHGWDPQAAQGLKNASQVRHEITVNRLFESATSVIEKVRPKSPEASSVSKPK